ncbi:MAG: hypothetical protein KKD38_09840 [Candidatus Delongbacteria bacterium]|nr:hypothetical protein [Candidatus Delongbacteria bacterium]MCG2760542.1 hypothetical protein [Candidatus Delongbacteria bacterium]
MINYKKYYILILSLSFLGLILGQTDKNAQFDNHLGVKASNISGYGIYYSKNISESYRLQAMGIIYYYEWNKNEESETIFNYDLGLEIQKDLYNGENSRTYLLFGGYYYFDDATDIYDNKTNTVNNSFNIGTGIGFEFEYKRVVYNFDIGYKFFEDDIDTFTNGDFSYNELKRVTKIGAGIGIGFMF